MKLLINRKEGNDKEPIQLPYTFRPRHQTERRTHLKHNQNTSGIKPKGRYDVENEKHKKKKKKKSEIGKTGVAHSG